MLLLNEKETKILLDCMEFLETLGTPEATKQAEKLDEITYSQTQGDADAVDLLLGCFNELDKINQYDFIYNAIYNMIENTKKEAYKEIEKDNGYYNIHLKTLYNEIENLENIIERLEY